MFDGDYITANGWPRQGGKGGVGGPAKGANGPVRDPGPRAPSTGPASSTTLLWGWLKSAMSKARRQQFASGRRSIRAAPPSYPTRPIQTLDEFLGRVLIDCVCVPSVPFLRFFPFRHFGLTLLGCEPTERRVSGIEEIRRSRRHPTTKKRHL